MVEYGGMNQGDARRPARVPVWVLQERPDHGAGRAVQDKPEEDDSAGRARILCRACNHPITSAECRIAVNGSHAHTYFNPHGIAFEIGCFSAASGVFVHGAPSHEFSWFPGYAWRYAHCANCHTHLGWQFVRGRAADFLGLILGNLREK